MPAAGCALTVPTSLPRPPAPAPTPLPRPPRSRTHPTPAPTPLPRRAARCDVLLGWLRPAMVPLELCVPALARATAARFRVLEPQTRLLCQACRRRARQRQRGARASLVVGWRAARVHRHVDARLQGPGHCHLSQGWLHRERRHRRREKGRRLARRRAGQAGEAVGTWKRRLIS